MTKTKLKPTYSRACLTHEEDGRASLYVPDSNVVFFYFDDKLTSVTRSAEGIDNVRDYILRNVAKTKNVVVYRRSIDDMLETEAELYKIERQLSQQENSKKKTKALGLRKRLEKKGNKVLDVVYRNIAELVADEKNLPFLK